MNSTGSEPAELQQIKDLFRQARPLEKTHDIVSARKIEQQVARPAARIAAQQPDSEAHADALTYHKWTLLSLARTSRRCDVRKKLKEAAYRAGAAAVDIRLKGKHDLSTGYAAYNLAIDLIVSEGRPEAGLKYMLQASSILKALPRNQRPRNDHFFWVDYGIAKAHRDLGRPESAEQVLKETLRHRNLLQLDWGDLRGIAKCAELLAQIYLDRLDHSSRHT